MNNSFFTKELKQVIADLPLHKELLPIIHEYASIYFDLPFLEDAMRFFSGVVFHCDRDGVDRYAVISYMKANPPPSLFHGYRITREYDIYDLLSQYVLSDEIDVLTIQESEDSTTEEEGFTVENRFHRISMAKPQRGFTVYHVFSILMKYELLCCRRVGRVLKVCCAVTKKVTLTLHFDFPPNIVEL